MWSISDKKVNKQKTIRNFQLEVGTMRLKKVLKQAGVVYLQLSYCTYLLINNYFTTMYYIYICDQILENHLYGHI